VGPHDAFGAALAYVLVHRSDGRVSCSSRRRVHHQRARDDLEEHGGKLRLGARVKRIVVRSAAAVVLANGEEIAVKRIWRTVAIAVPGVARA
jgi:hypothetical protein